MEGGCDSEGAKGNDIQRRTSSTTRSQPLDKSLLNRAVMCRTGGVSAGESGTRVGVGGYSLPAKPDISLLGLVVPY